MTSFGPVESGAQYELVWVEVKNVAEERRYLDLGWHDHPSKAIAASGKTPPPISSETMVGVLEAKLAQAQAELDALRGNQSAVERIRQISEVPSEAVNPPTEDQAAIAAAIMHRAKEKAGLRP
jgi:hypothetical protein